MVSLNSNETNPLLLSIPITSSSTSALPPPQFKPSSTSNRTNISLKRTYSNNTFDEAESVNNNKVVVEEIIKEPLTKKRLISPQISTNNNNNFNELENYFNSISLKLKENELDFNEYSKREKRDFLERLVNNKTYSTRLGSM